MQRVNYDKIAHLYDEPLRDHSVDPNLLAFLKQRPDRKPSSLRVLDVGCGTGKQQTANQAHISELQLVGLDLFYGMLQQAQKRGPAVNWLQGDGARLPFAADTFDYVCNQFSYPHIQQKELFIREVYRVLKQGGRFCLQNIDPWEMPNWHIYRYFPAAQEIDTQDFLPVGRLVALLEAAGFTGIDIAREYIHLNQSLSDFYSYAAQRYRSSQFMAITDEAYAAGLARITADLQVKETIECDICLITITADKL